MALLNGGSGIEQKIGAHEGLTAIYGGQLAAGNGAENASALVVAQVTPKTGRRIKAPETRQASIRSAIALKSAAALAR